MTGYIDYSPFMIKINPHIIIFFFNDTATTEIYTLSLHDALPILKPSFFFASFRYSRIFASEIPSNTDRKSTRLNSSHSQISYAVFCLKKKKTTGYIDYAAILD